MCFLLPSHIYLKICFKLSALRSVSRPHSRLCAYPEDAAASTACPESQKTNLDSVTAVNCSSQQFSDGEGKLSPLRTMTDSCPSQSFHAQHLSQHRRRRGYGGVLVGPLKTAEAIWSSRTPGTSGSFVESLCFGRTGAG